MARQIHIPSSEHPYHVGCRAHNKEKYPISLDHLWRLMCDELVLTHHLYNLKIHSFVLMPNHFHLLASTPDANLSEAMRYFMGRVSKEINFRAQKINQNHGSRFFRCLIGSYHYYMNAYKYVYRNPVKAGLCMRVEEYRYSSLQMYLGLQSIDIPLFGDPLLMDDLGGTLKWLNTPSLEEDWSAVRKALRHGRFKLPICRTSRRPHTLETGLL